MLPMCSAPGPGYRAGPSFCGGPVDRRERAVYGVPLAAKAIQPVWIEVENREEQAYFLLSPGLDPNFFPASEAAEALASDSSREQQAALDRRFRQLAFRNPVLPGATTSGFVLTNLDEGVKLVQLDLVASRRVRTFSVLTVVPGFRGDYKASEVFRREIYSPEQIVNYTDDAAFRAALEVLPCCATNRRQYEERRSAQSGDRGWPRRCLPRTRAARLASDRGEVVGLGLADGDFRAVPRALFLCAGERSLPVRPPSGHRAPEGPRQHPPAQSPAALAKPDALPRQAGVGGPDQPRHRQPSHHPFPDADDAQDRPRCRRSTRGARGGHGLFAESSRRSGA